MTLQQKFFIPIILLVLVFGVYLRLYWVPTLIKFVHDEETATVNSHLRSVSHGLVPLLLENQLANVYDNLDSVLESNESWKYILLYDQQKRLLYPLKEPSIDVTSTNIITLKQPVKVFDDSLGELVLIVDLSASTAEIESLQKKLNIALLFALSLFIAGIFYLVRKIIYTPLNLLIDASQKISRGTFDSELPKGRQDEIGRLIKSFSDMRTSIDNYQQKLRKEIDQHKLTTHELTRQKEQASYHASHDSLTGLNNRREFELRLAETIDDSHVNGSFHALVYMDLDQFKVVNDTCGHIAGDTLLKQLSSLLLQRVRDTDILARLGGDEFGLILKNCNLDNAKNISEGIYQQIQDFRFDWQGQIYRIGVSMGLVPIKPSSDDMTALLSAADTACYAAKDLGRNKIHVFSDEDIEVMQRQGEMQWVSAISKAIEEQQFILYQQPITLVTDKKTTTEYRELLLRMKSKGGDIILPGAFLPAAERYNQIESIDRYVIEYVCRFLSQTHSDESFGINISGASISNESFLPFVTDMLNKYKVDGKNIVIEITESIIISNLTSAKDFIRTLRTYGCRFALDDFGMGLSSLEYLKHLDVDYLKIDGYFVRDICADPIDKEMVRSINEICRILKIKSIAEFVESREIFQKLSDIGVNFVQGYWIGVPEPLVTPEPMYATKN